jgi:hypothetical protein
MTMPHLINCDHSEDGWCLDCVKTLHDEHDRLRSIAYAAEEFVMGHIDENQLAEMVNAPDEDSEP